MCVVGVLFLQYVNGMQINVVVDDRSIVRLCSGVDKLHLVIILMLGR